jgi:hypothetical protein
VGYVTLSFESVCLLCVFGNDALMYSLPSSSLS